MRYAPLLGSELAVVRAELVRVDGKCGTLAALTGAAAALTATQVTGDGSPAARVVFGAAAVALATATVVLLTVLRPSLGDTGFCRYATMPERDLEALFVDGRADHRRTVADEHPVRADEVELKDLRFLSVLTRRKYRRLRLAVDLAAAGVVLVVAGALAGVIA